jgi:hypothetical protein
VKDVGAPRLSDSALPSDHARRSKAEFHEHVRIVEAADRGIVEFECRDSEAPAAMVEKAVLPNVPASERFSDRAGSRVRNIEFIVEGWVGDSTETP